MVRENPPGQETLTGKTFGGYFFRRLESAEAASCFVVLLVLPLRSALDAFEATVEATVLDVLTEFLAMCSPPFWRSASPYQEVYNGLETLSGNIILQQAIYFNGSDVNNL